MRELGKSSVGKVKLRFDLALADELVREIFRRL